jgi:hypothetical protein
MTDINQNFNDPKLESIINNATEKNITANHEEDFDYGAYHPPEIWCIIVIILYAVTAGIELLRFKQTRNMLHLVLSVPAIFVVAAYALELGMDRMDLFMIEESLFFFAAASWMTIIVPTHLLSIWVCSMFDRFPTQYRQHLFRFVQACLALLSLTKLIECFIYSLYIKTRNDNSYTYWVIDKYQALHGYYKALIVLSAIETAIICILELFCIGILLKSLIVVDPGLIFKRRQLILLILMYLTQLVYSACSIIASIESLVNNLAALRLFGGSTQTYICVSALFVYFILTILPREAITGFDKVSDLPTLAPSQHVV